MVCNFRRDLLDVRLVGGWMAEWQNGRMVARLGGREGDRMSEWKFEINYYYCCCEMRSPKQKKSIPAGNYLILELLLSDNSTRLGTEATISRKLTAMEAATKLTAMAGAGGAPDRTYLSRYNIFS